MIAIECDELAVPAEGRMLSCPHDEPVLDSDGMHYLGFKLMFCHDCSMIFAGELLEDQRGYFSLLSEESKKGHYSLMNQRQRWLSTRKINWIHCGEAMDLGYLMPSPDRLESIESAFQQTGDTRLTPVRELLGESYSFDEIDLAKIGLLQRGFFVIEEESLVFKQTVVDTSL